MKRLVGLYPADWRARYGPEFDAVLEVRPPSARDRIDIVRGAICRIESNYLLVEILPEATLIVPKAEIDWTDRRHPGQLFQLGDRVNVKILTLEPDRQKASGSIKQGYTGTPKPPVSPPTPNSNPPASTGSGKSPSIGR